MSATNRGATRIESDYYPTPLSSFYPLVPYLDKSLLHWEPACGDRRLINAMAEFGIYALGIDIEPQDSMYDSVDFLSATTKLTKYCVITNPPFTLAKEFIEQAFKLEAFEIFYLLRLNFLGSKGRKEFWLKHEPQALFVLSSRPSFTGKGTDACEYAWFYWGLRHKGIFHL
jgi:hypothetical protein